MSILIELGWLTAFTVLTKVRCTLEQHAPNKTRATQSESDKFCEIPTCELESSNATSFCFASMTGNTPRSGYSQSCLSLSLTCLITLDSANTNGNLEGFPSLIWLKNLVSARKKKQFRGVCYTYSFQKPGFCQKKKQCERFATLIQFKQSKAWFLPELFFLEGFPALIWLNTLVSAK